MNDYYWMSKALQLARNGIYSTHPNPRVGCVIVNNGALVGQGWHKIAGEPHAEIHALREAGEKAQGATAYVTLEPCSHYGRTPPCVDALIAAKVAKVVIAIQDPNPQVAGRGIAKLKQEGVTVECGILADEAEELNKGFIKRMQTGLPWVTAKLAMSLDGRTAMANGESQWITGSCARSEVQRLRASASAILTTANTVLMDNARLTVRTEELNLDSQQKQLISKRLPLRVLLDSQSRVLAEHVFYSQEQASLTISSKPCNLQLKANQQWLQMPCNDEHIGLETVLQKLGEDYGVNELFVEAGATLNGLLTQSHLVDEYLIFVAPKFLGSKARPLLELPFNSMLESMAIKINQVRMVGDDFLIQARPA